MSTETWSTLRHLGRQYRQGGWWADAFSVAISRARAEGATWTEISSAAQVAPATARRYARRVHTTAWSGR